MAVLVALVGAAVMEWGVAVVLVATQEEAVMVAVMASAAMDLAVVLAVVLVVTLVVAVVVLAY
tara:strand:- start:273 stop:461 length:189 start_codon:yes stop_codon:yes gene_type:complete